MPKRKTNVQIVKSIMEQSKHGALVQIFVIQALNYYCQTIINQDQKELQEALSAWINEEAWQGIAHEIKEKLDSHYPS